MKLPVLKIQKSDIQGHYNSNGVGFGVIVSLPENTELKTGMTLYIGELKFTVSGINGLNPSKNTYVLSLSGADLLDLILKHA